MIYRDENKVMKKTVQANNNEITDATLSILDIREIEK